MLGELLSETKGKITSQRVLSAEGPKMEASFTSVGKLKGVDIMEIATFWSMPRAGGALFGDGKGVMMTRDGEHVTWSGNGIGKLGKKERETIFEKTAALLAGVSEQDIVRAVRKGRESR